MKTFIEVNGSDHLNIIFNESIENVAQMKLKNKKNKVILEVSLDLKIYFIYTVYSYRMKKILLLNLCCLFLPKKSKTLYSGHLVITDTFFRNRRCLLWTGLTVCSNFVLFQIIRIAWFYCVFGFFRFIQCVLLYNQNNKGNFNNL